MTRGITKLDLVQRLREIADDEEAQDCDRVAALHEIAVLMGYIVDKREVKLILARADDEPRRLTDEDFRRLLDEATE